MADLPLARRVVSLLVITRRFRCDAVLCGRQIFLSISPTDIGAIGATHGRGWTLSSIISIWCLAADPQRASQNA
ncbi:hypothetical protein H8B02_18180 [Bradyrhizobium sp. Pear77]|uniref:hypothetical protein n=1 Tax=Bradyrhizobium TaxID=374 RepID=UPI001E5E88CB|nr:MULTISPECIES: hypothetical protein [Bradyrhizobium]MCC8955296.1 hypothetical protein [Bradyrhizobium altum]MCC8962287.1 hypothetical protein [Bradyrhizobium oropedii]